MKITTIISLRSSLLAACVALPCLAFASQPTQADRAAELLARHGTVSVASAGPYVETGTFRVQVAAKLGQPDLKLADGTWLYHHRRVDQSNAEGTLVVRFASGRVSSLALATPAVVAMIQREAPHAAAKLVATK